MQSIYIIHWIYSRMYAVDEGCSVVHHFDFILASGQLCTHDSIALVPGGPNVVQGTGNYNIQPIL